MPPPSRKPPTRRPGRRRRQQAAQDNEPFYASCDAARAAGRGPINRGESGYRSALDPNNNGVACEGTANAAAAGLRRDVLRELR